MSERSLGRANYHLVTSIALTLASIAFVLFKNKRISDQLKHQVVEYRRKKKLGSVNIGGVFGMDVGGTLTKIVYFEAKRELSQSDLERATGQQSTSDGSRGTSQGGDSEAALKQSKRSRSSDRLAQLDSPDHQKALEQFYSFMDSTKAIDSRQSSVIRDDGLTLYCEFLQGKLYFMHFETKNMVTAIKYVSSTAPLVENIRTIGCTGGGAHKFAGHFEEELGITFDKFDELMCLVRGMHFALNHFEDECYTYRKSDEEDDAKRREKKIPTKSNGLQSIKEVSVSDQRWRKDIKEHTRRVTLHFDTLSSFPYLVVNIGSGVSIVKVTGPGKAERVSGTSLGGGTYWGLSRLLTTCKSYEEVLNLAEQGDASVVDMLVRDIYGGDYTSTLTGGMVASSFGKLVTKEKPREGVREEDLAVALLMMITNNIGQVSYLTAQLQKCSKIYFVGNFLRHNPISCRRLAFAIDFWSGGKMEALFLCHEGYFGALGTFLTSAFKEDVDKIISINMLRKQPEQPQPTRSGVGKNGSLRSSQSGGSDNNPTHRRRSRSDDSRSASFPTEESICKADFGKH